MWYRIDAVRAQVLAGSQLSNLNFNKLNFTTIQPVFYSKANILAISKIQLKSVQKMENSYKEYNI